MASGKVTIEGRPARGRAAAAGFAMAVLRDVETGVVLERDGRPIESVIVLPAAVRAAGERLAKSLGLEVVS